jgi:hypothetical protein
MTEIEVILPVGLVPLHSTVCKVGGTKLYKVYDKLVIHGTDQVFEGSGARILLGDSNHVIYLASSEKVKWTVTLEELHQWTFEQLNQSDK